MTIQRSQYHPPSWVRTRKDVNRLPSLSSAYVSSISSILYSLSRRVKASGLSSALYPEYAFTLMQTSFHLVFGIITLGLRENCLNIVCHSEPSARAQAGGEGKNPVGAGYPRPYSSE